MKFSKSISFLLLTLLVSACMTLKVKNEIVGTYIAENGEFIVIEKDGYTFWSPPSEARNKQARIGFIRLNENGTVGEFFGPDTSSYLGTRFIFSDGYRNLKVYWYSSRGREDSEWRAIEYEIRQ